MRKNLSITIFNYGEYTIEDRNRRIAERGEVYAF